ncbi:MAG TPA: glycine cleavage system aminomethyltransferase GcvT [Bacteroidota bacterium]|nr:glycine cleavage system aminomethyltransferase GcvT [Bacteroidota bacterium]
MKRTAFYDIHRSFNAKLVEFAGFEMPVQYSGILEEHHAVRTAVGIFDVSHMGEFEVRGKDALAFLQKTTTNDVSKLSEGKAQYSAMCLEHGGIVDDLLVYHCGDYYMLVVNAANVEKDFRFLQAHKAGDVELRDVSDKISLLAVQGPRSLEVLKGLTDADLSTIKYYNFIRTTLAGVPMIISRTGYTGELGFELYFDADPAIGTKVWNAVMEAGKKFGIMPVGLGARDTLRLEMGFCLYGNDIDESTTPLEAGLDWITKIEKGEFVGRSALLAAKNGGLKRRLVGFTLSDKILARHGFPILASGSRVGEVTSGTFSPTLQKGIGMGYVSVEHAKPGSIVEIEVRGKRVEATVVQMPFVPKHS